MIKNLPEIQPDKHFVEALWSKIEHEHVNTSNWWERFINLSLALSLLLFAASTLTAFYLLNPNYVTPKQDIAFELVPMETEVNNQIAENVLFIYDKSNNYSEVITDFEIKDSKLYLKILPGNYRIVFSSTGYKNLVVSDLAVNNS